MLIAAATKKGTIVDTHFGHAESFHIYRVDSGKLELERVSEVEKLSDGNPNHPFNEGKLEAIASTLKGCTTIYCQKIGERPKEEMEKRGFTIVEYSGSLYGLDII